VGIQYLEAWLRGTGAVPLYNLMEDAATAEISRAQVWQWLHHGVRLTDGNVVSRELVARLIDEEMNRIRLALGAERFDGGNYRLARNIFEQLVMNDEFTDFLTLPSYNYL
jgi:malate synthase